MTNENISNNIELNDEALDSVIGGVMIGEGYIDSLTQIRDAFLACKGDPFRQEAGQQIAELVDLFTCGTEPSEEAIAAKWKAISDKRVRSDMKMLLIRFGVSEATFG